jgi:mono/diheme cytochrome c family protein
MLQARSLASIAVAVATAVLLPSATLQAQNSSSNSSAANDYRTTLQLYCVGCHSGPTPFAGLNLEPLDFANLEANGEIWEKLIRKLRARQMPPTGMPRHDDATLEALVKYVESGRDHMAAAKPNPGRTTLHRLNRTEYGNAIRDLLALEIDVTDLLPADDIGYGFDNIGDVLSVSPFLLSAIWRRRARSAARWL